MKNCVRHLLVGTCEYFSLNLQIVICLPTKVKLELEVLVEEKGKPEYNTQGKTSRSKGENQQQTQPTFEVDARI